MSADPRLAEFPSTVYLLPAEGFILLPETTLPFTLVDAWSQRVLDATEEGNGYVGMIQRQREDGAGSRFFAVGCLARIESLHRDEKGHHVRLEGRIRFRIREELPGDPGDLPRAAVAYEEFAHDLDGGEEGEELPANLNLDAFKEKLIEFGQSRFGTAGILENMTPRQVIRFMAQTTPFTPAERQALLETRGFPELVETLFKLLSLNFLTTTPDIAPSAQAN